ncbi:hypothetical protein CYMTET_17654 [Cymbomonas tetramitiformis]|uniref:Uncharacterized protein n=1 Tax=Cymbomonas tetramitiformis TaxID=36881 RepID=A0AAE0G9W2_9CHLO|nr:hypothetical protein CYMTET_17654 [Cymbomonas tetramitiformis]
MLAHPSRPTTKDVVLEERRDMLIEFQRLEEAIVEDMPRDLEGPTDDLVEVGLLETDRRVDQPADAEPKEGAQRGRGGVGGGKGRDAIKSDGEIVAEPEEVHVEDVTMASDGQEPEPAAGAPSPAAPVAAPAVPPAGTGRKLESMLGLLAFCAQVVWRLSLYTRPGFGLVAATSGRLSGWTLVVRIDNQCALTQDRDDWQFSPVLFAEMDEEFGPFILDACMASSQANAFFVRSWSAEDDARKQRFDGLNAWANLPFSVMYEILLNFLSSAGRAQAVGPAR